jgi:hypothetical protein
VTYDNLAPGYPPGRAMAQRAVAVSVVPGVSTALSARPGSAVGTNNRASAGGPPQVRVACLAASPLTPP